MREDSRLKGNGFFKISILLILLLSIPTSISVTNLYRPVLAIVNTAIGNDTGTSNATSVIEPVTAPSKNILITINPGASDPASQNPISAEDSASKSPLNPSQLVVPVGGNVTWFNNDPSTFSHSVYSGDPKKGPSNIFYQSYLEYGKNFTFTFDKPGIIPWYDFGHIKGKITVVD